MHSATIRHKILTIPGLNNSGPAHWQSLWEGRRDDCRRIDLGCWSEPDRRIWTERLDAAFTQFGSVSAGSRG